MGARRVSQGITATQASHTVIHSAGVLPPMASRSQDVFDEPPLTQEERARVEQVVEILFRARQRQQERVDAALTPPDRRRVQAQRAKMVPGNPGNPGNPVTQTNYGSQIARVHEIGLRHRNSTWIDLIR